MQNDYEEKRRKTSNTLRSIYDYVMGVLWLSLGAVFIWHDKLGFKVDFDPTLKTIFGIAAMLYGAFRIYRGYKKN